MTKTMLYKHPGPHKIHGNKFDYIVTEDIEEALKDGWFLTTPKALEAAEPESKSDAAPTRDEIKQKADELGIEYPKNIKTPRLQKLVEDELDELDKKTTD